MNGNQHDRLVAVEAAEAKVNRLTLELDRARNTLQRNVELLQNAIAADPTSWDSRERNE
jgi:hypothetical protein